MQLLLLAQTADARLPHGARSAPGHHAAGRRDPCEALLCAHLALRLRLVHQLARVDLGHPAHAARPQARVLVAVPPAVDGALDQASLAAQTWVELCQGPPDGVAFALVHQSITPVLILAAARPGVDAVLRLEFGGQRVNIDRFDIATDGIFHLDAVPRVLKGNPLHAISVLSHNKRRRCRDRPWSRACIDAGAWDIVVRAVRRCSIHDLLVMLWLWLALWRGR